jgi:hypothetical protein
MPENRGERPAEQLWSLGADGTPQDPWQKVFEIPVWEIDGERPAFLLTGPSKGFKGSCKQLFSTFGKGVRENAGKVPAFGITKAPKMTLVEWFVPGKESAKKLTASKF